LFIDAGKYSSLCGEVVLLGMSRVSIYKAV
jgi:hypothetical protein